ncbi:S49 family peptidase [Runella salmonicolor]|uniref:S49 family peptidase n=1 Tax=Runella salmonicolor TaxID=2950278 RepID=A0ABT1FRR4_9BACT|nr:S49 family peptidase [Runella salmonicolor]MCP1384460.1 S49 family peptidase [Runella salmonicolor]
MHFQNLLHHHFFAMEKAAYYAALQAPIHLHLGAMELPKVEMVAAENSYSSWEMQYYFGIKTDKQKSGLVAIIPVKGVLAPEWSWGGTNTEWLSQQIAIAIGNEAVSAIVLTGNSGGGAVTGTMAWANSIATAKNQKPIVGHVQGMVASAAYWGFSACNEIFLESATTSAVGSIGVMSVYTSYAKQLEKEGIDVRVLRSKGAEDKALLHPAEALNEDALKEEQKLIDAMRVEFLGAVQSFRPQIINDPGGKLYYGRDAIRAGLADNVGTRSDAIKRADYLARKAMSLTL